MVRLGGREDVSSRGILESGGGDGVVTLPRARKGFRFTIVNESREPLTIEVPPGEMWVPPPVLRGPCDWVTIKSDGVRWRIVQNWRPFVYVGIAVVAGFLAGLITSLV